MQKIDSGAAERSFVLETPVRVARADHSFNGVLFEVRNHGVEHVRVSSVSVGGELGRMTVWSREGRLREGEGFKSARGWRLEFEGEVEASWKEPRELRLEGEGAPVRRGESRSFLVHSASLNDRGLVYNSYAEESVFCSDSCVSLVAGCARIGTSPFARDGEWGWYAKGRGLVGAVSYRAERRAWTPVTHGVFPAVFRRVVETLLMCWGRDECRLSALPLETLHRILRRCDWRDFKEEPMFRRLQRRASTGIMSVYQHVRDVLQQEEFAFL